MKKQDRVDEVISTLQGTCKSLQEVLTETELLDALLIHEVEMVIMRCETCSWWVEVCEMDEENNCEQCSEENDDE